MTEIRVDADLEQPPTSVRRARTTARLVTDWLPTSRFMVRDNGMFAFHAERLEGLEDPVEGEIVTSEAPHSLVMRWEADDLHTVVALTIEEQAAGSRSVPGLRSEVRSTAGPRPTAALPGFAAAVPGAQARGES